MSVLSIGASIFVGIVALITAYITYLNLRVITEVSIYVFAKTVNGVIEQNNYSQAPDRINVTFHQNGLPIPPPYPTPIRWFDIDLGNTGPGTAIIESWVVDYSNPNARDASDMKSENQLILGPQSRLTIVGQIPRDYSLSAVGTQGISYQHMKKLPTTSGTYPWKVEIIYKKKMIKPTEKKFKMEFEVNSNGSVKSIGPIEVDN